MLSTQNVRKRWLAVLATCTGMLSSQAHAKDLSAGVVLRNMEPQEQYTYVAGIIEGLAYARFVFDGNQEQPGMACIYNWFYEEDGTYEKILAAFASFPDHLPGAVTGALVKRRCG